MKAVLNVAFVSFVVVTLLYLTLLSGCSALDLAAIDRIVADVNDAGAAADTIAPLLPAPLSIAAYIAGGIAAGLSGAWVVIRRRIKASQSTTSISSVTTAPHVGD